MTGTLQQNQPSQARPIKYIGTYSPLSWQVPAWRDQSLIMLLTGSAGGGKSRVAAEKLHGFCLKYPGAMALAMRKTRESMTNSTVLVLEGKIIAGDPRVKHNQSKNRFEYENGSILAYGGMKDDQQRQQIRSIGQDGGLDICWMEEANAFTESDFNEVLARMRGKAAPWRQVILSTNPDSPTHWIFKRLIEGQEGAVFRSAAIDNTYNPAEYVSILNRLTGVQGERLSKGLWVQAEGSVYPSYDPRVHTIKPFPIPDSWRRIRSIDFGYTNPFVCQWWAIDEDGRMYLYREVYWSKKLVEDHAAEIIRLTGSERIEATVADHDAEDRATLERHGIRTRLAFKLISPGIQAVEARLQEAGDGRPRFFIFQNALVQSDDSLLKGAPRNTAEEFPGYVWPKGQDGKPIKEEPVKLNDHGCDAARYAVCHVDDVGAMKAASISSMYVLTARK